MKADKEKPRKGGFKEVFRGI